MRVSLQVYVSPSRQWRHRSTAINFAAGRVRWCLLLPVLALLALLPLPVLAVELLASNALYLSG